jgi:hypothetical protein
MSLIILGKIYSIGGSQRFLRENHRFPKVQFVRPLEDTDFGFWAHAKLTRTTG